MDTTNTSNSQYDPNRQYGPNVGHDEGSPEQGGYAPYGTHDAHAAYGAQAQDAYAAQAAAYQQYGGYPQQQGPYSQQQAMPQGYPQTGAYPQQGLPQGYPGMQGGPQGYPGMYPGMQPGMQPQGQPYGGAPAAPEQPGGKKQKKPKEKRKRGAGFWVALIIALIALAVAGVFTYLWFMDQQPKPTRSEKALEGQLEGKSAAEIQDELNRIVEEGMLSISIASVVTFPDGESEGELRIENSPANNYLMDVEITRNDTGETIYNSGIFGPNTHIQKDKLDVDLPKGQYNCTALFHALDPETEEEIGQAAAEVLIIIGS